MASKGTEKKLSNIPGDLSEPALKYYLSSHFETRFGWDKSYDFQVKFDSSAEASLWKIWDTSNLTGDSTKSARLVLPTPKNGVGIATQLGSFLDVATAHHGTLHLGVEAVETIETLEITYEQLLRPSSTTFIPGGQHHTTDWTLGNVTDVQYGNFISTGNPAQDVFQEENRWKVSEDSLFNKFSYFGDQWPSKFQVCLQDQPGQNDKHRLEWMDLHLDNNIRGIIFDTSSTPQLATVWFVVDKPPQFYQRTQGAPIPVPGISSIELPAWAMGSGGIFTGLTKVPDMIKARIRYPTRILDPVDAHICGIPWDVQYSRVFKITYIPRDPQNFTFDAFKGRLTEDHQRRIVLLERDITTVRKAVDTVQALQDNMNEISNVPHGCQIAYLKLLYNCNISLLPGEIFKIRSALSGGGANTFAVAGFVTKILEQSAHSMETSYMRSLRRLHADASAQKKLPETMTGKLVEPLDAIREALGRASNIEKSLNVPGVRSTFKIMVFPSHLEIFGPELVPDSFILTEYEDKIDRFIRVRFLDNDGDPFRVEPGINPDIIVRERILNILNGGHNFFSPLQNFNFDFLGYSVSSLKKRKMVWFFRTDETDPIPRTTANTIRNRIGIWDAAADAKAAKLAGLPWKWGARMALAFTSSIAIEQIGPQDFKYREDIPEKADYPNTDGCGLYSSTLGTDINLKLQAMGYSVRQSSQFCVMGHSYPIIVGRHWGSYGANDCVQASRAFQIRLGGVKGVVYHGPDKLFSSVGSPVPKVLLRSSQIKFNVADAAPTFRVVSTTGDYQACLFFESLVQALENLHANSQAILDMYKEGYENLTQVTKQTITTLQSIVKMANDDRDAELMSRYSLLKLAGNLVSAGVTFEMFGNNSFLTLYLRQLSAWTLKKNLFAIPIPGSFSALGLTDDYQILTEKDKVDKTIYEVVIVSNKKFVSGDVLIYRDPIIHIGDLKIARALTDVQIKERIQAKYITDANTVFEALKAMDNVVFFSQEDRPPLPNQLSGGDLDGDRFEIIPKDGCTFWTSDLKHEKSDDYAAPPDKSKDPPRVKNDFDIADVTEFISQYIRQDCFDELQTTLIALADARPEGMKDPDVMEFAAHISRAVDFAKSGTPEDLLALSQMTKFRVKAKPDILRGRNLELRYSRDDDYYHSTKLLGQIYQMGAAAQASLLNLTSPGKLDNERLRKEVTANRAEAKLSQGSLETVIAPLRVYIQQFVKDQLATHREYLKGRNIPTQFEMNVFMTKPRDANFPEANINSISDSVKKIMNAAQILHLEQDAARKAAGYTWKLAPNTSEQDAGVIFRQIAYEAWESALALTSIGGPDKPNFGESYAFLCLYVVYCRKFSLRWW